MSKTIEVPCPDCGVPVPVEITYGDVVAGGNGQVEMTVTADKFEPWQHGLVCAERQQEP